MSAKAKICWARGDVVGLGRPGPTLLAAAVAMTQCGAAAAFASAGEADIIQTSSPSAAIRTTEDPAIGADAAAVAALDLEFQRAVKTNDVATMDRILHRDFFLVLGNGAVITRKALLDEARLRTIHYDVQDEEAGTQTVRLWGPTAVVTAKLRIEGRKGSQRFARTLWFSDTYVRTPEGWKYAFAQASLPLPDD